MTHAKENSSLEMLVDSVIAQEKEGYHNDLVPFDQHAALVREEITSYFIHVEEELDEAKALLQRTFTLEEEQSPFIVPDARFETFELCTALMREKFKDPEYSFLDDAGEHSMQETFGIPWPFMDRSFAFGKRLLHDKRYEKAEKVFFFLRYLAPSVFEYWFSESLTQYYQGKYKEAINHLTVCLALQPENPLVCFQTGVILFQTGDKEGALVALDLCLQYADAQHIEKPYVHEATRLRSFCISH